MKFTLIGALASTLALTSAAQYQHVFATGPLGHHDTSVASSSSAADADTSSDFQPGSLYDSSRLIKVSQEAQPRWLNIDAISVLRQAGVRFMDITDAQDLHSNPSVGKSLKYESKLPSKLEQQDKVNLAISKLSTDLYGQILTPFTAFHNRYYDSENGRKSSHWLQQQIEEMTSGSKANVTVSRFEHRFKQPSVVARVEGTGATEETVVISAHQDSVNLWLPWFGRANGADDDGSGTVTILEALRVLLATEFRPLKHVEFHWYAGEEGGLLGSQDIAKAYQEDNRKVAANMHFDMTGFWLRSEPEVIGLVSDNTDKETRELVARLAKSYTRLETREFACGYGCSDHASWHTAGYRSAMAFESDQLEANTNIHTPQDTIDTLDFNHMLEFSKLAVAFAYEVGYSKD